MRRGHLLAALVVLVAIGAIAYLQRNVDRIEEALPMASLQRERDFAALNLDLHRLEAALRLAVASPEGRAREHLTLALDLALVRLGDNIGLYGGESGMHDLHDALEQGLAALDRALASADGRMVLAERVDDVARLREAVQTMNDTVFQSSMAQVAAQREHLGRLRDSMVLLLVLFGIAGLALVVLLLRRQGIIETLERQELELRTAEQALRERSAVYEQMFQANTAPKLLIDPDSGAIVDANPAAVAFYGYRREQLLRLCVSDINTMDPDAVAREMAEARVSERTYFEFRHRLADGRVRDVQVYSGPVVVGGRRLLHSIIHDVTDERRYLAQVELYRELVEMLPVGVYRASLSGVGRLSTVNSAMLAIFEADSAEELHRHPMASFYVDPAQRERLVADLRREGVVRRNLELMTLHGRRFWAAVVARIQRDGDEEWYDAVLEDVTERRLLEQEREYLTQVIEALPDHVAVVDREGRSVYLNPAARQAPGGSVFLAEQGARRLAPDASRNRTGAGSLPPAEADGVWRGEGTVVDERGQVRPVMRTLIAHRDDGGEVQRVTAILHDLSPVKEAEHFSRLLLESISAGVFGLDGKGCFTFLNATALRLLGYEKAEPLLGRNAHPLIHGVTEDGAVLAPERCRMGRVVHSRTPLVGAEEWLTRADGSGFPARVHAAPVVRGGHCVGVVVSFVDLTEQKAREAQIEALANSVPGAVYQFRAASDGTLSLPYASAGLRTLCGLPPDAPLAEPQAFFAHVEPQDVAGLRESIDVAVAERVAWQREFRLITGSETKWVHGRAYPRVEADGAVLFNGVLLDVTEQKRLEVQLKEAAERDQLTGVWNRRRFEQLLQENRRRARRYGERWSLIMFDVDHFKQVNDGHGHDVGDFALQRITAAAVGRLRDSDRLARWGGEEFMVLLPHTDLDGAAEVAEALREAVAGTDIAPLGRVTISLGVAEAAADEAPHRVTKRVDEALYRAKTAGRNRVCLASPAHPVTPAPG